MRKFLYVGYDRKRMVKPLGVLEYDGRMYAVIKVQRDSVARMSGFKYELAHIPTGEHIIYLQSKKRKAAYDVLKELEDDTGERLSLRLHKLISDGSIHIVNYEVFYDKRNSY